MSYYHIYYNNETVGPYEMEQLRQMVSDGILKPDSLIFPEGATDWVPANQIDGLFEATPLVNEPAPAEPMPAEAQESASEQTTHSTEATEPKPSTTPTPANVAPKPTVFSPVRKIALGPKPTMGVPKGGLAKKMTNAPKTPTGKPPANGSVNITPEQKAAFDAAMAKRDAEENKMTMSKKKIIIIASIAVVALTTIAGVAFFFLKKS